MEILTIMSTKGGVGKTTLTANLGGLLADIGKRVLLVDADVQPSLSKYFPLGCRQPAAGFADVIMTGGVPMACITPTVFRNLDIILSDDPEGRLGQWLLNRIDRAFRLRRALRTQVLSDAYDIVLIDTQGAVGPLQDAAVLAADRLVSPITPEVLSAREFRDGTLELLQRLAPTETLGLGIGPLTAVIYRQDRTLDARDIGEQIRGDFESYGARVGVLDTVVPNAKAYKEAATLRLPVHRHEPARRGRMPSACEVMHRLMWELMPPLCGRCSNGFSGPVA